MNPTTTETQNTNTESTITTPKPKAPKKAHPAAPKAHRATPKARPAKNASRPTKERPKAPHARQGTKTAKVLALLQRPDGATVPQRQNPAPVSSGKRFGIVDGHSGWKEPYEKDGGCDWLEFS